ncbi:MAG: hypothetical protein HC868_00310 [Sphingomonadales bacterium]|nr:hypothetical protein [Sphingomonadales bacterium]
MTSDERTEGRPQSSVERLRKERIASTLETYRAKRAAVFGVTALGQDPAQVADALSQLVHGGRRSVADDVQHDWVRVGADVETSLVQWRDSHPEVMQALAAQPKEIAAQAAQVVRAARMLVSEARRSALDPLGGARVDESEVALGTYDQLAAEFRMGTGRDREQ